MKKNLSFLTVAILGGVVSLFGYISFFDNGHLIEITVCKAHHYALSTESGY